MYDVTKLVPIMVFKTLLKLLPTLRQRRRGRKRVAKEALLNGILQVLVNGVPWRKMALCGCSYGSCFRYFQELERRGKLKLVYQTLAKTSTDLKDGSIDTTTIPSFEFERGVGWDGHDHVVGTKVSLFADRNGLPADVSFGKGNTFDRDFVKDHLKNTYGKRKKIINVDMRYMGLSFRREMRQKGIRVNMKTRDQDYTRKRGPKFKFDKEKYALRFLVERLNGWIQNFWRLRLRREYHLTSFKAFVYLALIIILIRR